MSRILSSYPKFHNKTGIIPFLTFYLLIIMVIEGCKIGKGRSCAEE
jgi:hypothetical protein